jgi:hypothetical protein
MDDSAPPATGPWMIIDHLTGEVIVDNAQPLPAASAVPTTPSVTAHPSLAGVKVVATSCFGTPHLTQTPPTLLSDDEDVRPQWLTTAVDDFLHFVPYIGSLGKVVDLFLTQEARLGYPALVSFFTFCFIYPVLTIFSPPAFHSRLKTGPPKSPHL